MSTEDLGLDKLSYLDRKALINQLDKNSAWKKFTLSPGVPPPVSDNCILIEFMHCEMDKILAAPSPSEKLLDIWGGRYGHTVLELFTVLNSHKMYAAMNVLRSYVPTKYHKKIKIEGEVAQVPQQRQNHTTDNNNTKKNLSATQVVESAGTIPPVSYQELEECTSKWSDYCVLGRGGYATVFKGRWKNTVVAIKRIEARRDNSGAHEEQLRQSMSELQFLNAYRHENILPIYAYSIGGPYPCLVYQFMSGGSLDKRIHTNDTSKMLSWMKRLDIAIGAARGLQYLHTLRDKPLVHVDIKPANILLDANDVPKIGDFGLARLGPDPSQEDVEVSRTFGTLPYLPYEFVYTKRLKPSLDVYSFGVLLFEIGTGLPVKTNSRPHIFLRDHVTKHPAEHILQLKDARVPGGEKVFVTLIVFGKSCVDADPAQRPTMVVVLQELEKARSRM